MKKQTCILIAFVVYIVVVIFNTGFIATDEYWDGITRYLPAQKATMHTLIRADDVKSPLQILPMHGAAQLGYQLGIESPFQQYHFVIIFWGLVGFGLCLLATHLMYREQKPLLFKVGVLALAFHFATPGLITRPMFEALAAPWIALSCAFAVVYDEKKDWRVLVAGVFTASMAFTLRQQTGFCALVFVILPLMHKQWKHFALVCVSGALFFVLAGIPDIYLREGFHHSLRALADYNFKYGSDYGNQPWHFFLPLILIFTFSPWLVAGYADGFYKQYFRRYRSLYIILGLFLVLHSMFANKFERFLISMIPVLLFIMTPFVAAFIENWKQRKWRLGSMLALNLAIWFPASFFPAQKNITDLARFLDAHPEYTVVENIDESITWIPDAFIRAPGYKIDFLDTAQFMGRGHLGCNYLIVMNAKALAKNEEYMKYHFTEVDRFDVNVIESVAYRLNPDHNVRRSPLTVFGCRK